MSNPVPVRYNPVLSRMPVSMKLITIKAAARASSRTRNRLREHGPVFKLVREDEPICFAGVRCVFVRSGEWFGWLPLNEIEVINESR